MDLDPDDHRIREPIAEGVFYPADAETLESEIRGRLQNSPVIADHSRAVVVPYASYSYAGTHLASAFKSAAARPISRVLLIGPCHRDPGPGVYVPESSGFRIPTGVVTVDSATVATAVECGAIRDDMPHLDEHSLEVQLPFVHYLYPRARIVPLLTGGATARHSKLLATILAGMAPALGPGDLLVVAANVSGSLDRIDARREAGIVINTVLECRFEALSAAVDDGDVTAAGAGCIAAALRYVECSEGWEILSQGDSYSVDGDPSNCVEYAAIALGRDNE